MMTTMIGNHNDSSIKGKVQFGSGWSLWIKRKEGRYDQSHE